MDRMIKVMLIVSLCLMAFGLRHTTVQADGSYLSTSKCDSWTCANPPGGGYYKGKTSDGNTVDCNIAGNGTIPKMCLHNDPTICLYNPSDSLCFCIGISVPPQGQQEETCIVQFAKCTATATPGQG